jgi:hypothetical protein
MSDNTLNNSNTCPKPDFAQRLLITLWVLLIFILITSKFMYKITNSIGLNTFLNNIPTFQGYVIHTLVFGLLVFLSTYLALPTNI